MLLLRQILIAGLLSILLPAPTANAADRNCTAAEKELADQALWLNKRDQNAAIKRHLPYGLGT